MQVGKSLSLEHVTKKSKAPFVLLSNWLLFHYMGKLGFATPVGSDAGSFLIHCGIGEMDLHEALYNMSRRGILYY